MKVQCSCGAKYEFDIRPEMASQPVKFVCPACGLDASEFVDGLIRQELGQASTPTGVPVPVFPPAAAAPRRVAPPQAAPAPAPRPAVAVRVNRPQAPQAAGAPAEVADAPLCLKHAGELATEKCYVCSKPICPKCMELFGYVCSPLCKARAESHGIQVPVFAGQKSVLEARLWRKVVWTGTAVGTVVVALLGFWFWFTWFGSIPKPMFSVRFEERSYSGASAFAGKDNDQLVFLHGGTLARHDIKQKTQIWSRELIDLKQIRADAEKEIKEMSDAIAKAVDKYGPTDARVPPLDKLIKQMARSAARAMTLYVRGQNIWVASPGKLVRYDWESGSPVKEITVKAGYGGLISRGDELVVVDTAPGKATITHINLMTCESRTEDFGKPAAPPPVVAGKGTTTNSGGLKTVRGPRTQEMAGLPVGTPGKDMGKPMDPNKVAEQAQHLPYAAKIALPAVLANSMTQERTLAELNDQGGGKATDDDGDSAPSGMLSLIPTKDGFVQFSVKLLEARVIERAAMKEKPGKSVLEGNVRAADSMQVANEILNEMQRNRGGDKVEEDISRYRVTLRGADGQNAWSGEVVGRPTLYPLQTVNVVTANKLIIVLDKSNKKLWQSSLNFNVQGGLGALDEESATYGQGPCVERKDTLYVFDEGVLSAFELSTGNARWRLPSVGIAGLFFDDKDMMYVNTTTASPESIKYSRQIDVSQKVGSVVQKVDAKNGKVLWTAEPGGLVNYVSGKYIFAVQAYNPGDDEEDSMPQSGLETPPYLRIRRINPKNGREMWEHFEQRAPLDVQFDKNTIRLVFRKEVLVLKFLTL